MTLVRLISFNESSCVMRFTLKIPRRVFMSKVYECDGCGKQITVEDGAEAPECCGEPMPVCTMASVAEHARPFNDDEPCDDGRAGFRQ
jgi:hypothetical protein